MILSCCYGSRWKQRWKNVGLPNEKRKPDGQNMGLKWFIMFINWFYDCIAFMDLDYRPLQALALNCPQTRPSAGGA